MNVLLDTNILTRLTDTSDPQHALANNATRKLGARGDVLRTVPQVHCEFWVVGTRPKSVNGLGLSSAEVERETNTHLRLFPIIDDTPDVFYEWLQLVASHHVLGKKAHDARLAAAMAVHGVRHILTFNDADFARFPSVTALHPSQV